MKTVYFSFIVCIACFLISPAIMGQDNANMEEQQQKAWMEYMTPGKAHEMMAKNIGEWKTETRFWMGEGEPTVSEGKSVNEMILGGRYLQSKYSGTAWGMQVEGMMLIGYDNITNEYTSIWIDNLGTGTAVAKGKMDEAANTINWNGTMVEPSTKQEMKYKEMTKFIDDNHYTTEMFIEQDGKEVKIMEINFSR
jgi:hypothetical protein